MRLRLLTLAVGAVLTVGAASEWLLAGSIIQLTPVTTIDLGAQKPAEAVPVVSSVALGPTGRQMATAGDDHLVRIWDFQQGVVLRRLTGHGDWVRAVAFSPDGQRLATAGDDRRVRVWDLTNGGLIYSTPTPNTVTQTLAFSPDGRLLVAGGFGRHVVVIRAADGQFDRNLETPGDDVRALAFSPDGMQLAAAGRTGSIRVWNDMKLARDLAGHRQRVRALAYSPDGSQLASAGDEREIRLWNAATGALAATLPKQPAKLLVLRFCSPDFLAVGASDNVIRVWNFREGCEAFSLQGHTGSVTALVWNQEARTLISGSFDTTVRVWTLNLDAVDRVSQQTPGAALAK
jgi:WD40 repeat protein